MKYKIFAVLALSVLVLNLGASTFADTKSKKASLNQLVSLLPASDAVVTIDVKRALSEALPQVLSANQPLLAKVVGHMDEFQKTVGIDVRQFDDVAVGASVRYLEAKKYDLDPVIIARGQMTSNALVGAAKLASNGKYREEKVGERTIYIFDARKVSNPSMPNIQVDAMGEVALTVIDDKTVAFGDIERVRQTVAGKTRVAADLIGMLERSPLAVAAFAAKPPTGLKAFVPLDNDELGKNIDSIQYIYGNANVVAGTASVHATMRTLQPAQAASLLETLEGLQMIGKAFLGGSKAPDKRAYGRMIENAKFAVKGNELTLDLVVPQADIDVLVGSIK